MRVIDNPDNALSMRFTLLILLVIPVMPVAGQLPEAMDPATRPKTWVADLRMMMRHGRLEPALRDTLSKMYQFAERGRKIRITKDHKFSAFSTSRGILAFRHGISEDPERAKEVWHDGILIGIHASKHEPPPLPFHVESRIGKVSLMARITDTGKPLNVYDEAYFGEKCTAYEYGAGFWIRRLYVRNGRVIAISFGIEP
jgi:hypothetical protein